MSREVKISILIANYNNGRYIAEAFRSLLAQTESCWEAIIIDDGSTDSSIQEIRKFSNSDPRFRFYQNPVNIGYQRTLVRAIELAEAEIIGRLDPDDALHPEALEKSLQEHQKNPEVGLVYSDIYGCDEQLNVIGISKKNQLNDVGEHFFTLKGVISQFSTFKKHFYNKTAGFDVFNKRAEDQDLYMKLYEVAKVKHLPFPLYYYRIHQKSNSNYSQQDPAFFWHWVALAKMSERRKVNIEDVFLEYMVPRRIMEPYRWRYGWPYDLRRWKLVAFFRKTLKNLKKQAPHYFQTK